MPLPHFSIGERETIRAPKLNALEARVTAVAGALLAANNLSDLASAATARTNLGLGTAATRADAYFALAAHTHAIADTTGLQAALDAKLAASAVSAYGLTLIDDADAAAARTTLGLATVASSGSAADLSGNLAVARLNSGTSASATTFWRGDGTWATPAGGGGTTTNPLTIAATGGAAAGATFNGSAAVTIDYSTVGAAKTGAVTASGLTASATDKLVGRSTAGAGALEEIACTAAGRALLDDADASAQRTTLGLAAIAASGSGADLTAATVSYAKIQNVSATDKLLGRSTAGAGSIEEIACTAAGRAILDDADASAQRTTLGLAAIAASGSGADLTANSVALSKLPTQANNTILGNNSGAAAVPSALTAAQTKTLLAIASGDVSGLGAFATGTDAANLTGTVSVNRFNSGTGASATTFLRGDGTWVTPAGGSTPTGTGFTHITAGAQDAAAKLVDTADINDAQVTYAKIQSTTNARRLLGRSAATAGVIGEISLGAAIGWDGSGQLEVPDAAITLAKMSNLAANSIIGNNTGAPAVPLALTQTQLTAMLNAATTSLQGALSATDKTKLDAMPAAVQMTADAAARGAAIADYFATTLSLDASSTYDIECHVSFLKTTAGTVVWTWLFSSAPTMVTSRYEGTPITGYTGAAVTGAPVAAQATGRGVTTYAHAASGSLTTAVDHSFVFWVRIRTNAATTVQLRSTESAGTITPRAGSYMRALKII